LFADIKHLSAIQGLNLRRPNLSGRSVELDRKNKHISALKSFSARAIGTQFLEPYGRFLSFFVFVEGGRRDPGTIHLFDITIFFIDIRDGLSDNKELNRPDGPPMVVYQTGNNLTQ
jgi:hypothetical protein